MLLFVFSMTALTSCNKKAEHLIVGKWECINITDYDDIDTFASVIGMTWEFKADGTLIASLPVDFDDDYFYVPTATYAILGNVLTITTVEDDGDVDSEAFYIKELNNTKLLLQERDNDDLILIEFNRK